MNFKLESKLKELEGIENKVQFSNQIPDLLKIKNQVDLIKKDENFQRKITLTIDKHTEMIFSMIQSQNGNIITPSPDNNIKIWDKNWNCVNIIKTNSIPMVLIENKDSKIVAGLEDLNIIVFEQLGDIIQTLDGHKDGIECLVGSSNGNIISGSYDNTIKVWDEGGSCIFTLKDHLSCVNSLIETHDGYLVSGSTDNTIKIWDRSQKYKCIETFIGHNEQILSLVEDRDGNIWSGSDQTIKIWDREGNCLKTLFVHNQIRSLFQLKNGNIAAGVGDNLEIWNKNGNVLKL